MKQLLRRLLLLVVAPFLWLLTLDERQSDKEAMWDDWLALWDAAVEDEWS